MHGIFSEYYFDLVVAMLLFGLLGVMFVVVEYHVAIGVLLADIMITSKMISVIMFLEYCFGYHATFGLVVVSMNIFMMLVDVLFLGVLFSEMMVTCGS